MLSGVIVNLFSASGEYVGKTANNSKLDYDITDVRTFITLMVISTMQYLISVT
jgi:hypothetical protein